MRKKKQLFSSSQEESEGEQDAFQGCGLLEAPAGKALVQLKKGFKGDKRFEMGAAFQDQKVDVTALPQKVKERLTDKELDHMRHETRLEQQKQEKEEEQKQQDPEAQEETYAQEQERLLHILGTVVPAAEVYLAKQNIRKKDTNKIKGISSSQSTIQQKFQSSGIIQTRYDPLAEEKPVAKKEKRPKREKNRPKKVIPTFEKRVEIAWNESGDESAPEAIAELFGGTERQDPQKNQQPAEVKEQLVWEKKTEVEENKEQFGVKLKKVKRKKKKKEEAKAGKAVKGASAFETRMLNLIASHTSRNKK